MQNVQIDWNTTLVYVNFYHLGGVQVESRWTPWTPPGLHLDSISQSPKYALLPYFMWSPPGIYGAVRGTPVRLPHTAFNPCLPADLIKHTQLLSHRTFVDKVTWPRDFLKVQAVRTFWNLTLGPLSPIWSKQPQTLSFTLNWMFVLCLHHTRFTRIRFTFVRFH